MTLPAATACSADTSRAMRGPVRATLFVLYSLFVLLANLGVLRASVDFASTDPSASHILVVPFVTLALIYRSRKSIFSAVGLAPVAGSGVILLGLGCLLAAMLFPPFGSQADRLSWQVAGVVILWIGGFLLFYGHETLRAALFPLVFLGFAIPIPGVLLDTAIRILTVGSSETVAALLTLTGTPYHREGFVFSVPNLSIEIAEECSGIRSSIALLLTSLVAGHIYLRSGWSKALLVAAILPVAILKNAVRIVSLSLLSIHVHPSYLEGQLHQDGGPVFFLIALGVMVPVLAVLRRAEGDGAAGGRRQTSPA